MKAIFLRAFKMGAVRVAELPTPKAKSGQVLVKMEAASINPSDLVFLRNQYGIKKKLPVVPGFEGSGIVVRANAGLYGRWLLGKRVACHAPADGDGTWAEYMATDSTEVIPLRKTVTFEAGASLLVNPLTAWALLSRVKAENGPGFVQTAASSALGRMMDRLGREWGLRAINIVRRHEQVELLKKAGAVHVLDSTDPGFDEQLRVLCHTHGIGMAFDAVGGDLTARVATAMPKNSTVVVYGALSGEPCQMNPTSIIFEGKHMQGFWLTEWIKTIGILPKLKMAFEVQAHLNDELSTQVQARFPLEKIQEALALYKSKRSDGKVLLIPGQ